MAMADAERYTFTSESVSEGHPDKVADFVSDSILDAYLALDPEAKVACETLVKENRLILAGEITAQPGVREQIDHGEVARQAVATIGYTTPDQVFRADNLDIQDLLTGQSTEINQAVVKADAMEQGAGDQGIMFGYATDETSELMPLPILLSHRLARVLAQHRHEGRVDWLRPDSKTQVSVLYDADGPVRVTDVLVSTQHTPAVEQPQILEHIRDHLLEDALGRWFRPEINLIVNPSGKFTHGGPSADAGLTGRKIIVDTYGGMGRHGGGAFSGKDASKVDRSGAYFCRYVARKLVLAGLAKRVEIQVAYAIGVAQPVSVKVDTFGTGDAIEAAQFVRAFDFRPAAIIEELGLRRPIFRQTTNYGHFGKPELPWESGSGALHNVRVEEPAAITA